MSYLVRYPRYLHFSRSAALSLIRRNKKSVPRATIGPIQRSLFSSSAPKAQTQACPEQHHQQPQQTTNTNIDTQITTLPLVHTLRQNPLYKESRPHLTIPLTTRHTHLVAGSLSGPEMVSVAPYMFTSKPTTGSKTATEAVRDNSTGEAQVQAHPRSNVYSIFHVGTCLCGHPGYVHGGLLSVMFDEAFARCVSTSFRTGLGMTANLNVDFRQPALPGRVFVLRAETVVIEGRKAWVEGVLRMCSAKSWSKMRNEEEDVVVAEGKALFIEPRFAEVCIDF